jgi:hypothetical protein
VPRLYLRLAVATLVLGTALGCSNAGEKLPFPTGREGRIAVRCASQWFLVGGALDGDGAGGPVRGGARGAR